MFSFQGETALHLACEKGLPKLVKVLLDNGGNPNSQTLKITDPSGGLPAEFLMEGETTPVSQQTPLHLALAQGNSEIVSLFLQFKCKYDMSTVGKFYTGTFCFVASAGVIVKALLDKR